MNTHTQTCSPKNCLSVKLVEQVVEFRSIFLVLATFDLWICCRLRDVDLQYSTDDALRHGIAAITVRSIFPRACKLQHSKYMSTCVSDDQSRRRENETTASYNNRRFEGRAGSGLQGSLYWDSACFFFFFAWRWKSMRAEDEKQRN